MRYKILMLLFGLLLWGGGASAHAQAPRVVRQDPRPDGSIVHVVRYGDTVQSIMAAYADTGITEEKLKEYNAWRWLPDYIYVDQEIIILPPAGGFAAPTIPSEGSPPVDAPIAAAPLRVLTAAEVQALLPLEPIAPFLPG